MHAKIFHARNYLALQDELNQWLEQNHIELDRMRTEFSTTMYMDDTNWCEYHTLIVFYVPLDERGFRK